MNTKAPNEVTINGDVYVLKASIKAAAAKPVNVKGLPYVVIRTTSAGVHAGWLKKRNGKEVELVKARRIWQWDGAASLSQLATEGVSKPANCKFSIEVEKIELTEAIEIIQTTEAARLNIAAVPAWKV